MNPYNLTENAFGSGSRGSNFGQKCSKKIIFQKTGGCPWGRKHGFSFSSNVHTRMRNTASAVLYEVNDAGLKECVFF
jgi:hypothetical protein